MSRNGYCPEDCKPKTNADRIRAMSDEELAERLALYMKCDFCPMQGQHLTVSLSQCEKILLAWLKQEVGK